MSTKTDLTFPLMFQLAAIASNGDIGMSLKLVEAWIQTEAQAADRAGMAHPPARHGKNTGRQHAVTRIHKLC